MTAPFTNLDFDGIKASLIEYMKGQDRFKDYDFAGSNLNTLLDVLAYNTYQNNFFTNMAISEMFLDSAQLRESVVSHAKELNYLPRSRRSARAVVDVLLSVPSSVPLVVIPRNTRFNAVCGTKSYTFFLDSTQNVIPVNGIYKAESAILYEGQLVNESFVMSKTNRIVLSNKDVDTTSIRVRVRSSSSAAMADEFMFAPNLFGMDQTSKVYYLYPASDEQYEIGFGENLFGARPASGSIVDVEYRICTAEEPNGAAVFVAAEAISTYSSVVTTRARAEGGSERESIESIKYFAPKSIQIQDRAVTESDYEILLKSNFPEIQAVSVYGGEEATPPRYGRVIVAVDVKNADGASDNTKRKYEDFLQTRCPIGIEPIVVSPEFMHVIVASEVTYNTTKTDKSPAEIQQIVTTAIQTFNTANLNNFSKPLRRSNLSSAIDEADPYIISNTLEILPYLPISPAPGVPSTYTLRFGAPLIQNRIAVGEDVTTFKAAIQSSIFSMAGRSNCFIRDNGQGVLQILRNTSGGLGVIEPNLGAVDYATGTVRIIKLLVSGFAGSDIKIVGRTVSSDITPPKQRLLSIRDADISVTVAGGRN